MQKIKKIINRVGLISLLILLLLILADQANSKEEVGQKIILNSEQYEDSHLQAGEQLTSRIEQQPFNVLSLIIFSLAILHTFFAYKINAYANKLKIRNAEKHHGETFTIETLRFMGEVEVIFGIWVIPLLIAMTYFFDWKTSLDYLQSRDFTEPLFVVIIMALASTRPIMELAEKCLKWVAKLGKDSIEAWWFVLLTIGPLLGSLITEPAAMTIIAILLTKKFYHYNPRPIFAFATLGLLFTNISVGGVLTDFAAPPVLLVRKAWGWDTLYMLTNFGMKAVLGVFISTILYFILFRKEFILLKKQAAAQKKEENNDPLEPVPFWISIVSVFFMFWTVTHAHYPVIFIGTFLLFLGFYKATLPYQSILELKTPILVGFFLAGLLIHGGLQGWWLTPLLGKAPEELLMLFSAVLSTFNDNATVTYLATLIPSFTESMKYAVVSGAVTGGGLTVMANAPNPAGQAILGKFFPQGISSLNLFLGALIPTLIVGLCFYFLP